MSHLWTKSEIGTLKSQLSVAGHLSNTDIAGMVLPDLPKRSREAARHKIGEVRRQMARSERKRGKVALLVQTGGVSLDALVEAVVDRLVKRGSITVTKGFITVIKLG